MERRLSPRVPLELPVEQILADSPLGRARTTDLSEGGLRIAPLDGEALLEAPFAWLLLRLPETSETQGEAIRALAERRPGPVGGQSYRIKYIYPRDRRRYEAFVRAAAGG